jgi:hypothetical protein
VLQPQTTPHTPPDIETVILNDTDNQNENNSLYQIFIPRDSFSQQHSNADIRKQIREAFSVHTGDFSQIRWETYEHCTIFVIVLTSKIVYEKYVGKNHPILKVPIFDFNSNTIEYYIKKKAETKAECTIKITEVPIFYETEALIKNIINITGKEIKSYNSNEKFVMSKYDNNMRIYRSSNRYNTKQRKTFPPKMPEFKSIFIEFKEPAAVKYLLEKGWSINIENFSIRIFPTNDNHPETKKRNECGYKITGLPINTINSDLKKILALIKGCTCTIPKPRINSSTKTAYTMVDQDDMQDKIKKLSAFNTTLYIIPLSYNGKLCTQCGSPTHLYLECDAGFTIDQYNRKTYNKIHIDRNQTKITIDENIGKNYGNILKIKSNIHPNSNNGQPSTNATRIQRRQQKAGTSYPALNNEPQRNNSSNNRGKQVSQLHYQTNSNFSPQIPISQYENDKIKELERIIKNCHERLELAEQKLITQQRTIEKQQQDINGLIQNITEIKTQTQRTNNSINKLVDIQTLNTNKKAARDQQLNEIT